MANEMICMLHILMARLFNPPSVTPIKELERLVEQAQAGDRNAHAELQVAKWNNRNAIGIVVFYEISPLQGKIRVRTISKAYVLGGDKPVIELHGVGPVDLKKIEHTYGR